MAQQRASDIDLVQDALNVAYPRTVESRNAMPFAAEPITYKEVPCLSRTFTSIKHAPPKKPRATWLDHTVPAPSSSSAESTPARGRISDEKTDRGGIYEGDTQKTNRLGMYSRSDNFEACMMIKEQASESTQDACMSGAIQDIPIISPFGGAFQDHSSVRRFDEETKSVYASALSSAQPRPSLQLSVISGSRISQCEPQASGFNEQVLEQLQVQMLREHGLRKTLRLVSLDLRKKSRWHAWKRAEEMLDKRDNARAFNENTVDWNDTQDHQAHVGATDVIFGEQTGQMWPIPPLVFAPDGAMNTLELGQISAISGWSAEMDISPEDHFTSGVIQCQEPESRMISTCNGDAGAEENESATKTEDSISPNCEGSTQSLDTERGLSFDETVYNRDYRGYHIRPVQTRILSEQDDFYSFRKDNHDQFLEIYDNSEPVTTSRNQSPAALSDLNTPTYMAPIENSPLEVPTTPDPLDRDVRPSVERDLELRPFIRESTPVYVDRSLTPSPVSYKGNHVIGVSEDAVMANHEPTSIHPRLARETTPSSQSYFAAPMLPPPSPVRSLTNSPSSRAYKAASPSMLRSPAIMRVIDQFQPSNWDTQFPVMRCDRSPSPSLSLSPCLKPQSSALRHNSYGGFSQPSFDMSKRSSVITPDSPMAVPLMLVPPPIPDDDFVSVAKRGKRDGRRKSAVQDNAAKVGKARSVTGGNGLVRGTRAVTAGMRQRVVTIRLAKALGEDGSGLKGECEEVNQTRSGHEGSNEDRMDIDTEDDASSVKGKGTLKEQGSQRRGQQLRRSTRLQVR